MAGEPARRLAAALTILALASPAAAHGPLFSPAPETIWKGGTEITVGYGRREAPGGDESEAYVEAEYGLTARWEVGAELGYAREHAGGDRDAGVGDLVLGTKYQFWGRDLPGAQYKASALLRVKLPTGEDEVSTGSTDILAGLAAGYESRRWYWFASGTYRLNTEGDGGFEKGDQVTFNAVGGVRPVLTGYRDPDLVLMAELNWEWNDRDRIGGAAVADSGGWQLFVAPVMWLTWRQFALRAGVQVPIATELNGARQRDDYRLRAELVYHF